MKTIKVLVWDLDHTLWDGILLEGDAVARHECIAERDAVPQRRQYPDGLTVAGVRANLAQRLDHAVAGVPADVGGMFGDQRRRVVGSSRKRSNGKNEQCRAEREPSAGVAMNTTRPGCAIG